MGLEVQLTEVGRKVSRKSLPDEPPRAGDSVVAIVGDNVISSDSIDDGDSVFSILSVPSNSSSSSDEDSDMLWFATVPLMFVEEFAFHIASSPISPLSSSSCVPDGADEFR